MAVQLQLSKLLTCNEERQIELIFLNWKYRLLQSRSTREQQLKFDKFLEDERAAAKHQEQELRKHAKAHKIMNLMVLKWCHGNVLGLLHEVYQVWSKWSADIARQKRWSEVAGFQLRLFSLGHMHSTLSGCFSHWK